MDEQRDPQTNAPHEGELFAAYLDADTDDITSARLERLLRQDPQAAARLDALARTRARLQRLDDVEPPEGFRERLQARLEAERAHGEQTAADPESMAVRRADRGRRRWFAPLTAAAALILVAVIGTTALLNQTGAGSGADTAAAPLQAESGEAAQAPATRDEDAAGGNAGEAEEQAAPPGAGGAPTSTADEAPTSAASPSSRAIPRISGDARLAEHLRRLAQASEDPYSREFEQRERAGLSTAPLCVSGIDETAADLVEFNERLVVAALLDGDVVLYDAQSCDRVRTFAAE
jgi:negative regulator of sigma E activity